MEQLLRTAVRCVLGYRTARGPTLIQMGFWSDGVGLWMPGLVDATMTEALRHDPRCAVWIPPQGDGDRGLALDGTARSYDLRDPLGLALHAPTISAAVAATAVKHRQALLGYLRDLPRLASLGPGLHAVVIRVRMERLRGIQQPSIDGSLGPVLPSVVPADIRSAVTGERRVTLAWQQSDTLKVQPAVWHAGLRLQMQGGILPPDGSPGCVLVTAGSAPWPSPTVALALRGILRAGAQLEPNLAVWRQGFMAESAEIAPEPAGGIELPD